jgi:hypothetical protein|tara:strand:+ start:1844 stop:2098 length:255 start_codon:yes stop_codon:yes gene_type:complete
MMVSNDVIYRVYVPNDGIGISVTCIGMECVDSTITGVYADYHALPESLKGRIAVLRSLKPDIDVNEIADVGKRINKQTYWVYNL